MTFWFLFADIENNLSQRGCCFVLFYPNNESAYILCICPIRVLFPGWKLPFFISPAL